MNGMARALSSPPPLFLLLTSFSWQELRQHPWRTATALLAIMLGVALGFAVHVINQSALDEFSRAVRSVCRLEESSAWTSVEVWSKRSLLRI